MKNIYNQYLGIIQPNRRVSSDTMDMKIRCKNDYALLSAVHSKPHFTIFDIIQPTINEVRLLKSFERNIEKIAPFQIDLNGFDFFLGSTCTLYVKVKDEKNFSEMVRYIKQFSNPILRPVKDYPPHYNIKNAHLTIARGILAPKFATVWKNWENAQYQSSTNADRMLLLRRPFTFGDFKYEVIGEYPFLGKGHLETQISMF